MTDDPTEFLKTRLARDNLFVEVGEATPTIEAARFGLEAWGTHAAPPHELRIAALGLLRQCRDPEGGWCSNPNSSRPTLSATYYATKLLAEGHIPGRLAGAKRVQAWLSQQITHETGVRAAMDIDEMYYGVRAACLIAPSRPFPDRIRTCVIEFLLACAGPNGGFGLRPGAEPDIERSYCSIHMLRLLGAEFDAAPHLAWITKCVREGNIEWSPDNPLATPATFYWGLQVASLVGMIIPAAAIGRNLSHFVCADGGYGEQGHPTIWHTYCGVRVADMVAKLGAEDVVHG